MNKQKSCNPETGSASGEADENDDPRQHLHNDEHEGPFELSEEELDEVEDKLPPRAQVLHETIRVQGKAELKRSVSALGWSALAAGLSMGFSMMSTGLLRAHLGEGAGFALIEKLGYPVGFVIVILARQQLFTENTMTAVLPVMTKPSWHALHYLLRLWLIVLIGNLVGVALFAYGSVHLHHFDSATLEAFSALGRELMTNSPVQMFTKGIVAGWLIATMVWLVPAAENAKVLIIVGMTYLIALGGFTHIIAGSTEVLFLVFSGQLPWTGYLDFALPTLAGNIVGGSLIFTLISHAQVRTDVSGKHS